MQELVNRAKELLANQTVVRASWLEIRRLAL